jgi:hypothetical protein
MQEISHFLWKLKVHYCLPKSPLPRLCLTFCKKLVSYDKELLAPRPIPKLEDHPLSVVTANSIYLWLLSISGGHLLYARWKLHSDWKGTQPNMIVLFMSKYYSYEVGTVSLLKK